MNQKDKELLLKDLCSRLPYGVICDCLHDYHTKASAVDAEDLTVYYPYCDEWEPIEYCKPYLRPMSSMTEEEENEFKKIFEIELKAIESPEGHTIESAASSAFAIDFYNKYHFDYRGLIERGIAIEAPKGMYDYD